MFTLTGPYGPGSAGWGWGPGYGAPYAGPQYGQPGYGYGKFFYEDIWTNISEKYIVFKQGRSNELRLKCV